MRRGAPDPPVWRRELTPVAFLRRAAAIFPSRVAVVAGGRRITYATFEARARRLASALRRAGLEPGERVAVVSPNAPAVLDAHFGVPGAGLVLVAVNTRLRPDEVAVIAADAGARLAIVDRELAAVAEALPADVQVVLSDDSGGPDDPYERLLAGGSEDEPLAMPRSEDSPIALSYTSGTTGAPKGAVYTHRGAFLTALGDVLESGLGYGSTYLWTLPMYHCDGWCFPWAVTAVAATHVVLRRPDPAEIWRLLDAEPVTHYCCAPTVQIGVVADPAAHRLDRHVRVVMGGAPPSPTLIARMRELGFEPLHLYGLTEVYGPQVSRPWDPAWEALDADGQARMQARQGHTLLPCDELRVVGADGAEVPPDGATMGEVWLAGNGVAHGYHGRPERTAESFRDGWFRSGDLAVLHPDGAIELRDRAKDIVISGGENISTIEVEQVLARHPAVLECAVVAVPDDHWGERPKAFVTLAPRAQASEPELIEHCRAHLAHFKCPDAVEFGELPKTATGKVQKFALREREWAGREKRVN